MNINFTPRRGFPGSVTPSYSVDGDTLLVNGEAFDLGSVPDNGTSEPDGSHFFSGLISRVNGKIHCTVWVPLGDEAASNQTAPAADWIIDVDDGPITLPITLKASEEEA